MNNMCFRGVPVENLSKDELIDALKFASEEIQRIRKNNEQILRMKADFRKARKMNITWIGKLFRFLAE